MYYCVLVPFHYALYASFQVIVINLVMNNNYRYHRLTS